tara:strand:+ start:26 stop:493 length:468 start_codon:yes stop_codon:yes gene_type:complete
MKKLYFIFVILLAFTACSLKKVEKRHGVIFLEKKQEKLTISKSNKNDVISLLGHPSTKSTFDNDVWIYIERINDHSSIIKFGELKIKKNNVLLIEFDNKGLLAKKEFSDLKNMQKITLSKEETETTLSKKTFIYDFLSSLRQKINDPLGVRKKRN